MLIGYARVSTNEQNLDLQRDALLKAGVSAKNLYTDKITGTKSERPGLAAGLSHLREGDTLVVWRLDRLGRSLKHLIEGSVRNSCNLFQRYACLNKMQIKTTLAQEMLVACPCCTGIVRFPSVLR